MTVRSTTPHMPNSSPNSNCAGCSWAAPAPLPLAQSKLSKRKLHSNAYFQVQSRQTHAFSGILRTNYATPFVNSRHNCSMFGVGSNAEECDFLLPGLGSKIRGFKAGFYNPSRSWARKCGYNRLHLISRLWAGLCEPRQPPGL
eukprot:gene23913-biopygen17874